MRRVISGKWGENSNLNLNLNSNLNLNWKRKIFVQLLQSSIRFWINCTFLAIFQNRHWRFYNKLRELCECSVGFAVKKWGEWLVGSGEKIRNWTWAWKQVKRCPASIVRNKILNKMLLGSQFSEPAPYKVRDWQTATGHITPRQHFFYSTW